ncbi:indoleamine 2,3-dioxygenase 2 isoform X3 [Ascaphus truei]|uniref:indoleamine 2,3-dioxygenase 2 isoform X3 n=1 Tax=Ascaphus truei TaxID=8439 RepID=UPI003F5A8C4B
MGSQGLSPINLRDFHVSEEYGFILQDPLEELPEYYKPWMSIAENLLLLIEAKQLRDEVTQMPELSVQHLTGYREQRLARLILSHITMGYVWQEGEQEVVKVLPRSLAVPYHQLSQALGLPLIMVHADLVLANWKRKDPLGPLTMANLSPIVCLPGGDSLRGFVLVTFLVEVAAVPGVKAVAESVSAVMREDEETLLRALGDLAESINQMSAALQLMFDYVDSAVFYNTIRPFLAGWRDNPAMPEGLIYEGASVEPLSFSGGSAAQSSVFHALDELLGIRHRPESAPLPSHPHRLQVCERGRGPCQDGPSGNKGRWGGHSTGERHGRITGHELPKECEGYLQRGSSGGQHIGRVLTVRIYKVALTLVILMQC